VTNCRAVRVQTLQRTVLFHSVKLVHYISKLVSKDLFPDPDQVTT